MGQEDLSDVPQQFRGTTDAFGTALIEGVEPGWFALRASKAGWADQVYPAAGAERFIKSKTALAALKS